MTCACGSPAERVFDASLVCWACWVEAALAQDTKAARSQ
jgi:hypothetical protein